MSGKLKQLRFRINAVNSTKKITKVMQMISAGKVPKAKIAQQKASNFFSVSNSMISDVFASLIFEDLELPEVFDRIVNSTKQKRLLLVFGTEKGLCGSINSNIIKSCNNFLYRNPTAHIFTIGRKITDYVKSNFPKKLLQSFSSCNSVNEFDVLASDIVSSLLDIFLCKKIDSIDVLYTHSYSTLNQNTCLVNVLPIKTYTPNNYNSFVEDVAVVNFLLEQYIFGSIYSIIAESYLSENNARMVAMDNATKNAAKLLDNLRIQFNRTRQSGITTELIEVIAGEQAT